MQRALGLLTAGLLFTAIQAWGQSKIFERTVPLNPGGSLDLTSTKGSVRLTAWERDQVQIRARIEADSDTTGEYGRRSVDATTIDVTATANRVAIRSNYENVPAKAFWFLGEWQQFPRIHYEIRAPKRLDVRLNIDRSETFVTGFEGRFVLEASRSEVQAADLSGRVRARMDRAGTSRFSDIRGSIDVVADRTNLRIGFARLEESRIEIDRGDAEVSVVRGQGLNLHTNLSRRANFDTNLQVPKPNNRRNREGPSGSINGGGPRLAIEADRGRVRLRG
jgi:hypothetical protein